MLQQERRNTFFMLWLALFLICSEIWNKYGASYSSKIVFTKKIWSTLFANFELVVCIICFK